MSKYIIPHEKIGRKITPISGVACDGYLLSVEGDNKARLLAISLVGEKCHSLKMMGWMTIGGIMLGPYETERLPYEKSKEGKEWSDICPSGWNLDVQHVMAHKATIVFTSRIDRKQLEAIRQAIAPAVVEHMSTEKILSLTADTSEARDRAIKTVKGMHPLDSVETFIIGSKYSRMIAVGPEVQGTTIAGANTNHIYLIGSDPHRAKLQFFARLVQATIPILPEWQDILWEKFQTEEWIKPLVGHRMAGFVVAINRENILDLIGGMVEKRELPRPEGVPEELW